MTDRPTAIADGAASAVAATVAKNKGERSFLTMPMVFSLVKAFGARRVVK
jgi:hypothetical protein